MQKSLLGDSLKSIECRASRSRKLLTRACLFSIYLCFPLFFFLHVAWCSLSALLHFCSCSVQNSITNYNVLQPWQTVALLSNRTKSPNPRTSKFAMPPTLTPTPRIASASASVNPLHPFRLSCYALPCSAQWNFFQTMLPATKLPRVMMPPAACRLPLPSRLVGWLPHDFFFMLFLLFSLSTFDIFALELSC